MKRARMSSPSASAAVADDNAAGGSTLAIATQRDRHPAGSQRLGWICQEMSTVPEPTSDPRILTKQQQKRSLLKFLGLGVLVLAILIGFGVAEAGGPGLLVGLVVAVVGALLLAVWSRRNPSPSD
jgi:hypothetical protein